MQAKLKYELIDCWNKSLEKTLRKEETQDCVIPDTMPDASRILYTLGSLLIRSKDVSAGKLKLEANIPTRVVFRDEDGGLSVVEVNVPVYMSVEDDSLGEDSFCSADMKLISLDARLLNPRKVLVRAEVSAQVCGYNKAQIAYSVGVEEQEHIHTRLQTGELSFVCALTEKTFAISDEQALPSGLESGEILCSMVELFADEQEEELTRVRRLKGYQEVLIMIAIAVWTIVVGYFISGLDIRTDFYGGNRNLEVLIAYIDACASAVGVANGLFIFFRLREQWIAWYICALLEAVINILSGQYVLLVLKLGYFTNTTYGYIKWSRYIKSHKETENTLF